MARVPTSGAPVRATQGPVQFQNTGAVTSGAFGVDVAQARVERGQQTVRLSDEFARQAIAFQIQQNEKELQEHINSRNAGNQSDLYGDGSAGNPGYYASRGNAAEEGFGPMMEARAGRDKDIMAAISNDKIRQMYQAQAASDDIVFQAQVGRFRQAQGKIAIDTAYAAGLQQATDASALAFNDPFMFESGQATIQRLSIQQGENLGLSGETLVAFTETAQSAYTERVFQAALAAGDPARAQTILDATSPILNASTRSKMQNDMKTIKDLGGEQDFVDALIEGGLTEEESNRQIEQKFSGESEKRAKADLSNRHRSAERSEKRQQTQAVDTLTKCVSRGGSLNSCMSQNIDAAQFLQEDRVAMEGLVQLERTIADGRTFRSFSDGQSKRRILAPENRQTILAPGFDLAQVRHLLTAEEFEDVENTVIAERAKTVDNPSQDRAMLGRVDSITTEVARNAEDLAETGEEFLLLQEEMARWAIQQKQLGKVPNDVEVREQLTRLQIEFRRNRPFRLFKSPVSVFDVVSGQKDVPADVRVPFKQINNRRMQEIQQKFIAAGTLRPSNKQIERAAAAIALGQTNRLKQILDAGEDG